MINREEKESRAKFAKDLRDVADQLESDEMVVSIIISQRLDGGEVIDVIGRWQNGCRPQDEFIQQAADLQEHMVQRLADEESEALFFEELNKNRD